MKLNNAITKTLAKIDELETESASLRQKQRELEQAAEDLKWEERRAQSVRDEAEKIAGWEKRRAQSDAEFEERQKQKAAEQEDIDRNYRVQKLKDRKEAAEYYELIRLRNQALLEEEREAAEKYYEELRKKNEKYREEMSPSHLAFGLLR